MSEANDIKRTVLKACGTILVGLVFQSCALLWWGGKMDARMTHVEDRVAEIAERLHRLEVNP